MCPSYRGTREELHSTRGRARMLFEMFRGDFLMEGWREDHVRESLDLCLISPSAVVMDRSLFETHGTFDESLPACEDYDLWLRITPDEWVGLVPDELMVKRGGHPDQLSKKYWGMDRFRVRALEKALSLNLTEEQGRLVKAELIRKSRILAEGFEKRKNLTEALKYRELISKHGGDGFPQGRPSPPDRLQNQ